MTKPPQETYWIDDAETLELLADPTRLEIIEILSMPQSVKDLADEMEVPRTRLYHHIKLLEEAGMIRVVEERPAGAMVEKIYQVAAQGFKPSEKLMEQASPRDQAAAVLESIFSTTKLDFVRAVANGLVSLEDRGELRRASLTRSIISLRPERLSELVEELEALVSKYDDEDHPDAIPVGFVSVVYPSSRTIS